MEAVDLTFDGRKLAKGWASVALASAAEPEVVSMYRAVAIEVYGEDGVQLVATNGYQLLRAWVPADDLEVPPPTVDEAPSLTIIAIDAQLRALNMLQWVMTETGKRDAMPMEVRLSVLAEEGSGSFAGMAARTVVLEVPHHETVQMRTYEAAWVDWRRLLGQFHGEQTAAVALSADALGMLVKLGRIHGTPIVWTFGGTDKIALLEVRESTPWVSGAVMPIRLTPEELEFAELASTSPGDGDLLEQIIDAAIDDVNSGALDADDLTVTASRA